MYVLQNRFLALALLLSSWQVAFGQQCNGPLGVYVVGAMSGQALQIEYTSGSAWCKADPGAWIQIQALGGSPDYTYQWSDGSEYGSGRQNLNPGIYTVEVIDDLGCSQELSVEIETVSMSLDTLAMEAGCSYCLLGDESSQVYFNSEGHYIAEISDRNNLGDSLATTEVCVYFDDIAQTCNGKTFLKRHWSVNPENDFSGCVKFYFTESELDELGKSLSGNPKSAEELIDGGLISLTTFVGGSQNCVDHDKMDTYSMGDSPPLRITRVEGAEGIYSAETCVVQFGEYYLGVEDVNHSLKDVLLKGSVVGEVNLLEWESSRSADVDVFELQRSRDSIIFETIADIAAKRNGLDKNFYSFPDAKHLPGIDYYRLKIIDSSGQSRFSNVVALIDRPLSDTLVVSPTLFRDKVRVDFGKERTGLHLIEIVDAWGRVLQEFEVDVQGPGNLFEIELSHLTDAPYYVHIIGPLTARKKSFKIIKIN